MMRVLKRVEGHVVRFGGEEHSGWLPPGAAKPPPTPLREVPLDFEIQAVTGGFVLCHSSRDGEFQNDSWHATLAEAEAAAEEWWGISPEQWIAEPDSP